MKKKMISLLLCTMFMIGAILPLVFADVPLTSRFDEVGPYGMVEAGVGLRTVNIGDITIDVPGTVVAAYLYWACIDESPGGDDTVNFDGTSVTADDSYGPEPWYNNYYHYVYIKDVTNLVNIGSDTYTISGLENVFYKYGAGLVVVYEDLSLPTFRIVLMDGLDGFWFGWTAPLGPNSDVACLEFDSEAIDRDLDMFLFVGGTEHDDRPNEVWTATGTGTKPTDLITSHSSAVGPYPLFASDGPSWDTYSDTVEVTAGDEWLCAQIESIETLPLLENPEEDYAGRGDSALLIVAGFVLPVSGLGKVTGGGQIRIPEGKASFGFNAMKFSRDPSPKGELEYVDHKTGSKVHAHLLDYLNVWELLVGNKPWPLRKAFFSGPCTVDHKDGFTFEVYIEDNGEPGKRDYFGIWVYQNGDLIYQAGDTILHGNIQIHKPPK
jgi:hypothetical protein